MNGPTPCLFFVYFRLFNTVYSKQMDSKRRPLVLEATTLLATSHSRCPIYSAFTALLGHSGRLFWSVRSPLRTLFKESFSLLWERSNWGNCHDRCLWGPSAVFQSVSFCVLFKKNGQFSATFSVFSFLSNIYRIKTVDSCGIWTWIVWVEGNHADHSTFTKANSFSIFLLKDWVNTGLEE